MPPSGKLPVLNLLTGQKSGCYALQGRLTDSRQTTWQGTGAPGSDWLCKISHQSAQGWECGLKNIKNLHFLVKSRLPGANPLTDFYVLYVLLYN